MSLVTKDQQGRYVDDRGNILTEIRLLFPYHVDVSGLGGYADPPMLVQSSEWSVPVEGGQPRVTLIFDTPEQIAQLRIQRAEKELAAAKEALLEAAADPYDWDARRLKRQADEILFVLRAYPQGIEKQKLIKLKENDMPGLDRLLARGLAAEVEDDGKVFVFGF